jgi:hypothetical protein
VLQGSHCPAISSLNSRSGRFAIASLANVARSFLAKCADKDGVQEQADLQLLNGKLTLAIKYQVVYSGGRPIKASLFAAAVDAPDVVNWRFDWEHIDTVDLTKPLSTLQKDVRAWVEDTLKRNAVISRACETHDTKFFE